MIRQFIVLERKDGDNWNEIDWNAVKQADVVKAYNPDGTPREDGRALLVVNKVNKFQFEYVHMNE